MSATTQKGRLIDLEDGITLEIIDERQNFLLGRKELEGYIYHSGKGTPAIPVLREKISKKLGINLKNIYIRSLKTEYGASRSRILLHVYNNQKTAEEYEPKYIIERNKTLQEEIEEAEKKEKKG
ncbi:MAG: 30S ribosomal protein S24e [Fervidicoccaceae archaeon]|nr:MAG: 30S ribosomal protein S24e [Fervidicoccus sp.]